MLRCLMDGRSLQNWNKARLGRVIVGLWLLMAFSAPNTLSLSIFERAIYPATRPTQPRLGIGCQHRHISCSRPITFILDFLPSI